MIGLREGADIDALRGRRVLVTGASGFIGANLIRRLLDSGTVVHAVIRDTSSWWRLRDEVSRLDIHTGDLADRATVERIVEASRPELIYHLAVERPGSYIRDPRRIVGANVAATVNLLESTATLDYRRMVVAGSSLEYGHRTIPLTETMPLQPETPFGASKAAASRAAQGFARKRQKPVVVLRLFSVFGYYESRYRLIPTAIVCAVDGTPMQLTKSGLRRDLIFVEDVVEAFIAAATTDGLAPGETLNVGSGRQVANEEVVACVEAVCGRKIEILAQPYTPHDTDATHWVADTRNVRSRLGWQPEYSLEEGIEKTARWIERHRDDYPGVGVRGARSEVAGAV